MITMLARRWSASRRSDRWSGCHRPGSALRNLAAAGKTLDDVVRVGVYLTDMSAFSAMNAVYERYFQPPYPARTAICVAALPLGAAVEIDAVAGP
jgi:enamine deaminase RidA (YjgF/YER057c/UK114 family)